jgi:Na+-driven multidrug efflux pump
VTLRLPQVPAERVLALAVPALGVLAAEPLYLLVDTAVVGRLGAIALAVGGVVLVQLCTQLSLPTALRPAPRGCMGRGNVLRR